MRCRIGDAELRNVEPRRRDRRISLVDARTCLLDRRIGLFERRVGLVERNLERRGIDFEQRVTLLDRLVFLDVDLDDAAGNIGRDRNDRLRHIGVVGVLITSAVEVEICATRDEHERHGDHQDQPTAAALLLLLGHGRCRLRRSADRRGAGTRLGRLRGFGQGHLDDFGFAFGGGFHTGIHTSSSLPGARCLDRLALISVRTRSVVARSPSLISLKASA